MLFSHFFIYFFNMVWDFPNIIDFHAYFFNLPPYIPFNIWGLFVNNCISDGFHFLYHCFVESLSNIRFFNKIARKTWFIFISHNILFSYGL